MSIPKKNLVVLNDTYEAQQAVSYLENSDILCLSLEAESYIKSIKPEYVNPLHEIQLKKFLRGDRTYYWRNFKVARSWYKEPIFSYVQDSFGYFLTEFDRSYDLASYIINKFNPKKIIIGKQRIYKGFQIIHGNLDSTTIRLVAKQNNLPVKLLNSKKEKINIKSVVGGILNRLKFTDVKTLEKRDILIIAPGRHIIQMKGLISELGKKVSIVLLTYNLDRQSRKILKNRYSNLLEKESFNLTKFKLKSKKELSIIKSRSGWKEFSHPKYKKNKIVSSFLKNTVKQILESEIGPILLNIHLAKYVLGAIKPKAIIITTDPDTKVLPYIKIARSMAIKTFSLQHGADFTGENPIYNAASEYYISWSKLAQKWSKKNIPHVKILAGHSQFHEFKKIISRKSHNHLHILFLTTINYYERDVPYHLSKLLNALTAQNTQITLVIRTHPSQPLENLKGLSEVGKVKINWDKSVTLDDAIADADVVIFENTTAGLDAMLARKPALYFNPYDEDDYFALQSRGIITILKNTEIEMKVGSFINEKYLWKSYSKKGYEFAVEYLGLEKNKDAKLAKLIIDHI